MLLKNAAQKVHVYAYDSTTGAAKTGDAAQITGYVSLDGTPNAVDDVNPAEVDATNLPGVYVFDLTGAETNCDAWALYAKSSTANIRIEPIIGFTTAGTSAALTASVASIANDAITAASIATGAIDADAIAADAIGASELAQGAADKVWATAARTLTAATNITSTGGTTVPQTGDSYARIGALGAGLTGITGVTLAATQTGVTIPTVTTVGTVTDLTNNMAKYANGAVWIDTVNGAAGTTSYVNGIASNPCAALASAKTIADNLKLKRFWVQAGSAITATADYPGYVFDGRGYALTVSGNRNFSSCQIERVEGFSTTGGGITCATGEAIIRDSHLLSLSAGEADFMGCHLNGTVTLTQASVPYLFHGCVGIGTLGKITFAAASQSVVVAKWSGDLTIAGMVSGNTLWLDGNGSVTLDATNSGGTVYIAGSIALTNSGAGQTINDTSRWNEDQTVASVAGNVGGNVVGSVASVTGAVGSVTGAVGSVTGAVGSVTGAVGSVAANGITATSIAADAINAASVAAATVTKIQNGLATPTNITAGTITTVTNVTTVNGLAANAITAASIATDAGAEIADAVWDEALAGHAGAGSAGLAVAGVATDADLAAVDTAVADVYAKVQNMPMGIKKNTALPKFEFVMTDSTTHAPKTGLTVSGARSIDGGAFAACTNTATITELANGVYWCDLSAADLNGAMITLRYTATGADDTLIHLKTDL